MGDFYLVIFFKYFIHLCITVTIALIPHLNECPRCSLSCDTLVLLQCIVHKQGKSNKHTKHLHDEHLRATAVENRLPFWVKT